LLISIKSTTSGCKQSVEAVLVGIHAHYVSSVSFIDELIKSFPLELYKNKVVYTEFTVDSKLICTGEFNECRPKVVEYYSNMVSMKTSAETDTPLVKIKEYIYDCE